MYQLKSTGKGAVGEWIMNEVVEDRRARNASIASVSSEFLYWNLAGRDTAL